jgi:UDP-glucose 4-epimerase
MAWLVTGGAGYIGSHVADAFLRAGFDVVVIDNLSSGKRNFVPDGALFVQGSVEDSDLLETVFSNHNIDGVIHLAGFKFAGESVINPLVAYTANTTATVSLLHAMVNHGVKALVFSSSCSVYGDTGDAKVDESFPLNPASPYGRSKLAAELLIRDCAKAFDISHASLRYFNVIGTRLDNVIDLSPHNIVPAVHDALLAGKTPRINGDDYDTPDGTCVRDYVDVGELADAHLEAAKRIIAGQPLELVYNLGSETGLSVKQIVDTALEVSGSSVIAEIGPRRPGDPASIVAKSDLASRDLGWRSSAPLVDMIGADWTARSRLAKQDL